VFRAGRPCSSSCRCLVSMRSFTGLSASCLRAPASWADSYSPAYVFRIAIPSPFNGVAAAAVAILACDYQPALFRPAFSFSFVLVLVLLLCTTRVSRKIVPLGQPDSFSAAPALDSPSADPGGARGK